MRRSLEYQPSNIQGISSPAIIGPSIHWSVWHIRHGNINICICRHNLDSSKLIPSPILWFNCKLSKTIRYLISWPTISEIDSSLTLTILPILFRLHSLLQVSEEGLTQTTSINKIKLQVCELENAISFQWSHTNNVNDKNSYFCTLKPNPNPKNIFISIWHGILMPCHRIQTLCLAIVNISYSTLVHT